MDNSEFSNLPDDLKLRVMEQAEIVLDNEINNLQRRRDQQQYAWEFATPMTLEHLQVSPNRENFERILTRGTNIRRIYLQAIEKRIETRDWIREFNRKIIRNLNN